MNMKITIMYNNQSINIFGSNRANIGEVLNIMANDGWTLDREIVIPRHTLYSMFTRHKLHLILKKEYREGEDPFAKINKRKKNNTTAVIPTPKAKHTSPASPQQKIEKVVTEAETPSTLSVLNLNSEVGDEVLYNGIKVIVVKIDLNQAIVTTSEDLEGSWEYAMQYCQKLGKEWKLPTTEEYKSMNHLSRYMYWTCSEINKKKAMYFDVIFDTDFSAHKDKLFLFSPIATVAIK